MHQRAYKIDLKNQLKKEQVGCLGGKDNNQKRRDERALKSRSSLKSASEKSNLEVGGMLQKERLGDDEILDTGEGDDDFIVQDRKKRIDVMDGSCGYYWR